MKYFALAVGIMFGLNGPAQQTSFVKVDFNAVQSAIRAEHSPFHYPVLFNRYLNADTTLNLEEFRYLYYGFTFQEAYQPYKRPEEESLIRDLMLKDTLVADNFTALFGYCVTILKHHPFSLQYLLTSAIACSQLGLHEEAKKYYFQYDRILSTILASGDGATPESAWSVILISDEAEIISALGFQRTGRQKMLSENLCDFVYVKGNEYGIDGFYFDISRLFAGAVLND